MEPWVEWRKSEQSKGLKYDRHRDGFTGRNRVFERLTCPLSSAVVLASYAVQSCFGDYNPSIHHPGYLSDSQFIPDQNDDFLTKVESLHEQHSGLKQSEAESCFINIARTLDFYGVELHGGRDLHNLDLMIGIASAGIAMYRKYICTSFYPWVNILKISFKRKKFFIHQRQKQTESREHIVAFNMLNYRSCKNLWKSCVEHHTFFQAKKLLPQEKNVLSQYWTLGSRNPKKSVNNQYCKKVIGGMVWNPAMRRSLSVEHLETKSLPSRSPPITPNWRSPRLRHEIRKPRHSSADNLANEMTYVTETEDVFYTYKGSLSPKDSDSEASQYQSPHRETINSVLDFVPATCHDYSPEASVSWGEYPFVRLSLSLHPQGAGCGQSLPGCSGSQVAVTAPLPLTGVPLLPGTSPLLQLPPPQSPASSSHSVLTFLILLLSWLLHGTLAPPTAAWPSPSPPTRLSPISTSHPAQGWREPTWFGISTPGIRVLPPAATFPLLLVIRCPPHHLLSILPAKQNTSAAHGERLYTADRPKKYRVFNKLLSKSNLSIPVGSGTSISENNPTQGCLTRKSSSSVSPSSNAPGSCSPDGVDQQFLEDFHRVTKGGSTEDSSQYYCDKNDNGDGYLVLIRITPDEDGKFGFNLKGGVDQKMPLVVSRINPESPADTCIPKLNEGDQIVLINGRDISEHTHDQVVMFIKASRESHTRELALVIRRKAVHSFADIKSEDELNQLFPEAIFPMCPEGGDTLEGSMEQLKNGLESGTVLIQFEQLYRKKPGLAITFAKLPQNLDKNRYKDVLPYDTARVLLQGNEDYINASYVNYIATQGPLPHTCAQFWQVIWDQKLSLIVMLTTLTERGRTKCHQYWPDPPDVVEHGSFHIRCQSEDCTIAYVFREMLVTNTETGEEHTVTHLQYVAWPDHGVPDDSSDFLEFVNYVKSLRVDAEPVLVHCSAGIGRTGVLVTMETAMCLIERNLPVYPLDIVRKMRDQRAMMVQTSSQYKFVCEAILRVYEEGLVQMLDPS
ncbi:Tyrosine-protein phosphatase non-receptor type 3 [Pteropus alecto]|uniref:protein-tyrosine-phosphatase n=1 Tax=Pteropus alecto TaxID=9402 RepID=L5L2K0_PTEAL|nr:Tyrosine-protein phosphatase non-receptor type 3 [Pteropus alecto]